MTETVKRFAIAVTIRFPDVGPDDVELLSEAADTLPDFGSEELRLRLADLQARIARMLLTAAPTSGGVPTD